MRTLCFLPLGFIFGCHAPLAPSTETDEEVETWLDYEVDGYDAVRVAALGDAETVIELVDFGKMIFGELETPYDTTLVEQDGVRIQLDRATNGITVSGSDFSAGFDVDDWVAGWFPTYREGRCPADEGNCPRAGRDWGRRRAGWV
jgi:hypothetical protein